MTITADATTKTAAHVLTREDVAALRDADDIVFYYGPLTGCVIHAKLRSDWERGDGDVRVFTRTQQLCYPATSDGDRLRVIPCDAQMWGNGTGRHDRPWNADNNPQAAGFVMLMAVQHLGGTWPTTAAMLKPGDTLTLRWTADHFDTDSLRDAGLHRDDLDLMAFRGSRRLVFHVATTITGDHSGRMIRRHG